MFFYNIESILLKWLTFLRYNSVLFDTAELNFINITS